ncbi:MAG: protein kinase [Candidatus Eisenbacteria bacterium]
MTEDRLSHGDSDPLDAAASDLADLRNVDWEELRRSHPDLGSEIESLEALARIASVCAAGEEHSPGSDPPSLLNPGDRLGRFLVEREAGRGGMGIVYKAVDERLDRRVAIKVLPRHARSVEWTERFAREAKLLASLSHPNIATIYTMEEGPDGRTYLVMEWVPGETLRSVIARGPIPMRRALEMCLEIGEALDAAHEGGVVHRDLKPGNVMVLPSGRVKVLDFGIARSLDRGSDSDGEGRSAGGGISGTLGYLAPEALEGNDDRRADVFSFGCVLYECLVGSPAFPTGPRRGESPASPADRLRGEPSASTVSRPDWSALPVATLPSIQDLIRGCLEFDPRRRIGSMRTVLQAIESVVGKVRRPTSVLPANVPEPTTSFVGRETELTECRAMFARSRHVTVTGPGGCGKTRLALRVASDPDEVGAGVVWFVSLESVTDRGRVELAVAAALGLEDLPPEPLIDRLAARLGAESGLLVIDNCEHVALAVRDLIGRLDASCPAIRFLATSRLALGCPGESVFRLEPMAVPSVEEIRDPVRLRECESVRLFLDRMGAAADDLRVDAEALGAVAEICRRVEGLPLAIELAAARTVVLTPVEVLSRMDHQLPMLREADRARAGRSSALRDTIAWSVGLLHEDEERAFRAFAVFADGWDLPAASFVLAESGDEFETLDVITRLAEQSLLRVERFPDQTTRYRYLEPIRQFAAEVLRDTDLESEVRRRHVAYFVAVAERARTELHGPGLGACLDRLDRDHENLLAAIAHVERSPGVEDALRIAVGIHRFWQIRGHVRIGQRVLDRLLERITEATPDRLAAGAFLARALLVIHAGRFSVLDDGPVDPTALRRLLETALTRFRRLGDRQGMASALNALGIEHNSHGDFGAGSAALEEARSLYLDLGEFRGAAGASNNLGLAAWLRRDLPDAYRLIGEGHALMEGRGDLRFESIMSTNLAFLSARLGFRADAAKWLAKAKGLVEGMSDTTEPAIGVVLCGAEIAEAEGRDPSAAWLFGAADRMLAEAGVVLTPEQPYWHEHDACVARLLERMGRSSFDEEYEAGRSVTTAQALRAVAPPRP